MPTDAIRIIYGAAQAAVSQAGGSSCLGVRTDAPNRKSAGLATPPNRADTCAAEAPSHCWPSLSSLGLHSQLLSLAVRTASDKSWASWASLSLGIRLFAHSGIFRRARIFEAHNFRGFRGLVSDLSEHERGRGAAIDRRFVGITCTSTKTAGTGMRIGEQLPCTREPGTRKDPFAVAVVRSSVSVSRTSACISIARGGGRIGLGVANRIHSQRKLFPRNFVKGQSAKILSLENLALYGSLVPGLVKSRATTDGSDIASKGQTSSVQKASS